MHTQERGDRVRGARVVEQLAGKTVHSKSGSFKEDFDEGNFYKLDNFLILHCGAKTFKNFKSKVKECKNLDTMS